MIKNKQQTFNIFWIAAIIVFLVYSCNSFKNNTAKTNETQLPVAEKTINIEISLGQIEKFLDIEKEQNSIDVTRDYLVGVSEGIYPFIKNHKFEIRKEFKLVTEKSIEVRKCYYYTKNGNVKLILYQWDALNKTEIENGKFKSIFANIEKRVTGKIGLPFSKKLKSGKVKNDHTYRDDVKWKSSELNAYLFRFGDRNNDYNQITLAIYKD